MTDLFPAASILDIIYFQTTTIHFFLNTGHLIIVPFIGDYNSDHHGSYCDNNKEYAQADNLFPDICINDPVIDDPLLRPVCGLWLIVELFEEDVVGSMGMMNVCSRVEVGRRVLKGVVWSCCL